MPRTVKFYRYRSAITGRYVKRKYYLKHGDTCYRESHK